MRLIARPGFPALAIAILSTGIAATTVMYSLVSAVLLDALPFADPERLVWMYNARTERDRAPLSLPDVEDYRREASSLAGLALFTNWTTNLTTAAGAERLDGVRVSGTFFDLLGTSAQRGRLLRPDDEAGGTRVVVMTHGLWQRRFGGDAAIVGREIPLNGAAYTVVGVLPPRFLFPFREAELAVPLTLQSDPRRGDRGANFLRAVARLAPGTTTASAEAELDAIAGRLQRQYPDDNARKIGISLYPLHAEIVRDYRTMLWTLLGSVAVLLLVGCVNLANLLLVRAAGRRIEFAVRLSLGASRARLARLVLGETAMLAVAGGVLGLVLAWIGLAAWRAWGPGDFPQMAAIALDWNAVAAAVAISALTAIVCGSAPAWFAARGDARTLRDVARTTTIGRAQKTTQRAFVAAQASASTILLVGMLVMGQGLARLEEVSAGFAPDQALSLQLSLPPGAYGNREALTRFFEALRERLHGIPGVTSAGAVSLMPLSGLLSTADIAFPDRPAPPPEEVPQAHLRVASAEYFEAAGIRILEGRAFGDHDRTDGQPVAVVSRAFADRHWPGERAVGQAVQIVQTGPSPILEVVGVVSDVKQFTLDAPATADLYVPLPQMPAFQAPLMAARMYWVVRGRGPTTAMIEAIRRSVAQVDPGIAASNARTLESVWLAASGAQRANVRLLRIFGVIALLLCAIGVYGVAAAAAATRRRELAIRAALGARRSALTRLLVGHELWPVAIGVGLGGVAAFGAAPTLFGSAFQTDPRNGVIYAGVAATIVMVSVLATYVPARSAGAANPAEALKA